MLSLIYSLFSTTCLFFRSENLTVESERMRGHYPQVGTLLFSLMIQHSRALCVKKSCVAVLFWTQISWARARFSKVSETFRARGHIWRMVVCVLALNKSILILYLIIFKNIKTLSLNVNTENIKQPSGHVNYMDLWETGLSGQNKGWTSLWVLGPCANLEH